MSDNRENKVLQIETLNQSLEVLDGAQKLLMALGKFSRELDSEISNSIFLLDNAVFTSIQKLREAFKTELKEYEASSL